MRYYSMCSNSVLNLSICWVIPNLFWQIRQICFLVGGVECHRLCNFIDVRIAKILLRDRVGYFHNLSICWFFPKIFRQIRQIGFLLRVMSVIVFATSSMFRLQRFFLEIGLGIFTICRICWFFPKLFRQIRQILSICQSVEKVSSFFRNQNNKS